MAIWKNTPAETSCTASARLMVAGSLWARGVRYWCAETEDAGRGPPTSVNAMAPDREVRFGLKPCSLGLRCHAKAAPPVKTVAPRKFSTAVTGLVVNAVRPLATKSNDPTVNHHETRDMERIESVVECLCAGRGVRRYFGQHCANIS